jgi:hypothetical protein
LVGTGRAKRGTPANEFSFRLDHCTSNVIKSKRRRRMRHLRSEVKLARARAAAWQAYLARLVSLNLLASPT